MTADGGEGKSLFVMVGEASGDLHTGRLLASLMKAAPRLKVWGVGGNAMAGQGVELLHNCQDFSVIGIVEVLRQLPRFAAMRQQVLAEIEKRKPDAVLLVDFGGFNIGLSQAIRPRHKDLPIVYFISPQVWGSRPWRINVLARTISRMLVIFPFEEVLYRDKGVEATFVGHPLAEKFDCQRAPEGTRDIKERLGLPADKPIVGIFPGSRTTEIKVMGKVILQAVDWLLKERPEIHFAMSIASDKIGKAVHEAIDRGGYRRLVGNGLTLVPPGENYNLMAASDFIWAKSGTTTLEATLLAKPMLIFYKGNWLSFLLVLAFKTVKHVGWPNILAGRKVVPELMQLDCRAEKLVKYTRDWLDVPAAREETGEVLSGLRDRLGQGDFTANAAREILRVLDITP